MYLSPNQTPIPLYPKPFAQGGEGSIYELIHQKSLVAKLYHPQERTSSKFQKLKHLIKSPPSTPNQASLAWPKEIIMHQDEFAGFLMPKVEKSHDLSVLCSLRLSNNLYRTWKKKYDRSKAKNLIHRLKIAYHIAEALSRLQATGQYIWVDMKPENIKVSLDGRVHLIDLDSVEVIQDGQILFPAQKVSPEYSPPELAKIQLGQDLIPETWTRFSMAVLFYKLFLGLHPFAVGGSEKFKQLVSHEQKIQAGLFPFGSNQSQVKVIPPPHKNFFSLPLEIQNLFIRCFDQGLYKPELRPHPEEWKQVLQSSSTPIIKKYKDPLKITAKSKTSLKKFPREAYLIGGVFFILSYMGVNGVSNHLFPYFPSVSSQKQSAFYAPYSPPGPLVAEEMPSKKINKENEELLHFVDAPLSLQKLKRIYWRILTSAYKLEDQYGNQVSLHMGDELFYQKGDLKVPNFYLRVHNHFEPQRIFLSPKMANSDIFLKVILQGH